jgi:putative membrane protein
MDLLLGTLVLRPYVFAFLLAYVSIGAGDLGWRRTLVFGAWVWPIAWLAEFCSTRIGVPFGFYAYTGSTRGQELFIADVPLMDSLSFTFLAYAAFCLARQALGLGATGARVTVLGGALMMLLDVVIDPAAVRGDRWFLGLIFRYPDGGVYFGVPLSNFLGWLVVGMVAIGGYIYGSGGRSASPGGFGRKTAGGVALYYAVIAFNLAVTAWIGEWTLFACGLAVHATAAGLLVLIRRRPLAWADMESQKA